MRAFHTDAAGSRRGSARRGFALLVVLWVLILLSLIVTRLTATGGSEARIANNLAQGAIAEADADGAVMATIFSLLALPPDKWTLDGKERRMTVEGATANVTVKSEQGKINPNIATPELLAALLVTIGVAPEQAARLSAAIADWREPGDRPRANGGKAAQYIAAGLDHTPPGEPFQSIEELGRVLGMTNQILAKLAPHLSLFQTAAPDPIYADAIVKAALDKLGGSPPMILAAGFPTVSVTAAVSTDHGAIFRRHAVIRLGAANPEGYEILSWDQE